MKNQIVLSDEQKDIIQSPINQPLIIRGVSGTGKTTAVFYRISNLIEKEKLESINFAYIGANKNYLNHICENLPIPKIKNLRKYTFEDFDYEVLGKKIRLIEEKEKIISLYTQKVSDIDDLKLKIKESKYKTSLEFKNLIDLYLENYSNKLIPKKDFILANVRIMKETTIRDLFFNTYSNLPIQERINKIKSDIVSKIQNNFYDIEKQIIEKRSVEIQELMKKDLSIKQIRNQKGKIFSRTEKLLQMLYKGDDQITDLYFGEMKFKNARIVYRNFIDTFAYKHMKDKELAEYLVENSSPYLAESAYEYDDLPAITYLHTKIFGTTLSQELKHVIIDNIEDCSEFQFHVIKEVLKSNSFTFCGDILQSSYFHRSVKSWEDFIQTHFNNIDVKTIKLNKIYNRPNQIVKLTNRVLEKFPKMFEEYNIIDGTNSDIPDTITVKAMINYSNVGRDIARQLRKIEKTNQYKTIAIIAKDIREARVIRRNIGNYFYEPTIIEDGSLINKDRVCIIPAHIAKGMEFDYVMIVNASNKNYSKDIMDIKLLYMSITKAKEKLDIYFVENISNLIIE